MNVSKPKVSVCVVTYNQEKYIRQCLQSIVDQKTSFEFEVIVADDCSTDGTTRILEEFSEKYPHLIRALFQPVNRGPTQNYFDAHNEARGEYVAHLDGDDYCLPGKLQRLAAHLDAHPGCMIVWHRMHVLNEHSQSAVGMPVVPISRFIKSNQLYAKDLAKYYGITGCHSGSMYRASAKKVHARNEVTLDYFSTLSFCINGGYASYIEEPYGVYRFFSFENTVTRAKGKVITGKAIITLMKHYLATNPELAKSFAAQCVLEVLVRSYLRYPLRWAYFKMLLACRTVPSLSDLYLIGRIFLANRNSRLRKAFVSTQLSESCK